jgi:hypothetical protein
MAVFVIALTEHEQRVVNAERDSHPEAHVRQKSGEPFVVRVIDTQLRDRDHVVEVGSRLAHAFFPGDAI